MKKPRAVSAPVGSRGTPASGVPPLSQGQPPQPVRIAVRGWKGNERVFEELLELADEEIESLLPQISERHARLLADSPHMIEIEFLDEPDQNQRFFRFGTDPRRMVQPIEVRLNEKEPRK